MARNVGQTIRLFDFGAPRMTRTCTICTSPDVIAISPGQQGEKFADLFAVVRGIPDRAFCLACWTARFSVVAPGVVEGINL